MSKSRLKSLDRQWSLALNEHEIELTELEFAVLRLTAAFNRWNEAASLAVGGEQLTASELNLLHIIGMQERPKSAATVSSLLNRDDQANIQYGLRKLRKLDLITDVPGRSRKTHDYDVTAKGRALINNFASLAREIVYPATASIDSAIDRFVVSSDILRILTGIFDESARMALTYPRRSLPEPQPTAEKPRRTAAGSARGTRPKKQS